MAVTAQAIVDRMQKNLGAGWKANPADAFIAGSPDTKVTGIVTTYAPSLEVMRKAVAAGRNMIIARESPYWARLPSQRPNGAPGGAGQAPPPMDKDPTFQAKRDYIAANKLVVYRLFANWNARQPDGQLRGLAKALGWEKYYAPSGGQPWATNNGFFTPPPSTLKATAQAIKAQLGMKSIRIGGDPNFKVTKIALSHGMYWLADLQKLMAEPGVDLLVMGEPQWENELAQYSFDVADSGRNMGLILLGQAISEDPGGGEMATWLKTFVKDVPVQWIPTGEPSWMPY